MKIILILILSLTLSGCTPDFKALIRIDDQLSDRKDTQIARRALVQALEPLPLSLYERAALALRECDLTPNAATCRHAITIALEWHDPDQIADAYRRMGDVQYELRDYQEALIMYHQAGLHDAGPLIRAHIEWGEAKAWAALANDAAWLKPSESFVSLERLHKLSITRRYEARKHADRARDWIERAIQMDPLNRIWLAHVDLITGQVTNDCFYVGRAREQAHDQLRLDPDSMRAQRLNQEAHRSWITIGCVPLKMFAR